MISAKKLIQMARKWQKVAAIRRKRISFPQAKEDTLPSSSTKASDLARKGYFVVYTVGEKRFEFPLSYLNNHIIIELFQLSKEEFGLLGDGPITLPCNAASMEQIVSLIKRNRKIKDLQRGFLSSRCSCNNQETLVGHQLQICS